MNFSLHFARYWSWSLIVVVPFLIAFGWGRPGLTVAACFALGVIVLAGAYVDYKRRGSPLGETYARSMREAVPSSQLHHPDRHPFLVGVFPSGSRNRYALVIDYDNEGLGRAYVAVSRRVFAFSRGEGSLAPSAVRAIDQLEAQGVHFLRRGEYRDAVLRRYFHWVDQL